MINLIIAAGWPIYPLLLASVWAIGIIIERHIALNRDKVLPDNLTGTLLRRIQSNPDEFKNEQSRSRLSASVAGTSLMGGVLSVAINATAKPASQWRSTIEKNSVQITHALNKNIATLGTIATAAPLLGLLGTIIGMVELFGAFNSNGRDVEQFASGISVALYNTAAGITIAVPALVMYRHYRTKVENYLIEIEGTVNEFLDELEIVLDR